jgi:hypothetical protein
MSSEILSFVDFFDDYSQRFLIGSLVVAGFLWILSLCFSRPIGSIVLSAISIFFDVTSGAANWNVSRAVNRVHALGSAVHSVASVCLFVPLDETLDSYGVVCGVSLSWIAEVLELSAIVATLDGWQLAVSATVLGLGLIIIILKACGAFTDISVDTNRIEQRRPYTKVWSWESKFSTFSLCLSRPRAIGGGFCGYSPKYPLKR